MLEGRVAVPPSAQRASESGASRLERWSFNLVLGALRGGWNRNAAFKHAPPP